MIHELIVTSAPRGLKPGRSGFTTVLQTRGIHPALVDSLEKASAYAHVYPQGDPRNPQIRSHVVRQGPWGTVSVVSRIVDAGNGYDGRSNKLAHHVAFDAKDVQERVRSSPAAALMALEQSQAFQRVWQGEPREQPVGPAVVPVPVEPGTCAAWTRAAGDAGWAGLIADRALRKEPTWIIAPPGVDLLPLYAEALALVNYQQRWGVTFTTYALSAGDALWLGTVDGSAEAQAARGQSRIAVVDLVRRPPLTAQSPLITAARGAAPVPWKREAVMPAAAAPAVGPSQSGLTFGGVAQASSPGTAALGTRPPPTGARPPTLGSELPRDPLTGSDILPPEVIYADVPPRRGQWLMRWLVFGVLVILGLIVGFVPPVRDPICVLVAWALEKPVVDSGREPNAATNHKQDSPTGQKPGQQPALTPPPASSDFGVLAEAERGRAAQGRQRAVELGVKANDLLNDARDKAAAIDATVKEAQAKAASAAETGASISAAIKAAETAIGAASAAIQQAADNKAEVMAAAEAARAAATAAAGHLDRAKQTLDAILGKMKAAKAADPPNEKEITALQSQADEMRRKVEAATRAVADQETGAEAAAVAAEDDATAYATWEQELKPPQQQVSGAKKALAGVQADFARMQGGFTALQAALDKAQHMPVEGIDGADPKPQQRRLCHVGRVRIALNLPREQYLKGAEHADFRLQCELDATTSGSWNLAAGPWDKARQVPLGSVRIDEQEDLVVDLVERTPANGAARDALACAALRIEDRFGTTGTDVFTYVQLAKPIEAGPLVFRGFLDGENDKYPAPRHTLDVPRGLEVWPRHWMKVALSGNCGQLEGTTGGGRAVEPHEGTGWSWSIPWTWHGKPVVETQLAYARTDTDARIGVVTGTLAEPWSTRERLALASANEKDLARFTGLPTVELLASQTKKVNTAMMTSVVTDLANGLQKDDPKLLEEATRMCAAIGKSGLSLDGWDAALRSRLAETARFMTWVQSAHPDQSPAKAAKDATPDFLAEFGKDAEKAAEWNEVLICRWIAKVRAIKAGKDDVRKLLVEALGIECPPPGTGDKGLAAKGQSPDATLTGEIYADFPSTQCRAVLMTFRNDAGTSSSKPTETPAITNAERDVNAPQPPAGTKTP